jgi:hypothetical protein
MADSQKMGRGAVSGGQKIDDHSFWAGGKSKGSPFPEGNKVKTYTSAEGAGSLSPYEDTTEAIKEQQEIGIRKAKAHKQKDHYKN